MGLLRHAVVFVLATLLLAAGCRSEEKEEEILPEGPGSFAFGVLGDTPYTRSEEARLQQVVEQLNGEDLAWVLHVGDILGSPCSDSLLQTRLRIFEQIRHPLVYTPGDNEWTDCHGARSGRYAPLERLARVRQVFFADPTESLGGRRLALTSQGRTDSTFAAFVENARWVHGRIVFATIHLVGSGNATNPFDGRTTDDDAEVTRRTDAALAWLDETFATADTLRARAVVLALHADPAFEEAPDAPRRQPFDAFLAALEEHVAGFGGPVLLVHGDSHVQRIDRPLVRRATGRRLDTFTRLEVFGSRDVGWVRVVVDTLGPDLFRFQPKKIRRGLFEFH